MEYDLIFQHKKRVIFPSRLFLYYNSRVLERTEQSNEGVYIRDAIKSVAKKGDCPEHLWPYIEKNFATRPPENCYSKAMTYRAVMYYRIHRDLSHFRACLASGLPFVFGFSAHQRFHDVVKKTGRLEIPERGEPLMGKHAVLGVGYDDSSRRLIVRNSWGPKFGRSGYFTMPYEYLLDEELSNDFWTIQIVS